MPDGQRGAVAVENEVVAPVGHRALHLVMLIGFRNRANVLVNWAWNYLTYDRGSRLIIEPDG